LLKYILENKKQKLPKCYALVHQSDFLIEKQVAVLVLGAANLVVVLLGTAELVVVLLGAKELMVHHRPKRK